jgi:hypothetical protein
MGFNNTAIYRNGADFDQGVLLGQYKGQDGFSSFIVLNDNTRFGICLALCLAWINNKVLPIARRVRGATDRMDAMVSDFRRATSMQDQLAKAWTSYSGSVPNKLKIILENSRLEIPEPISEIMPLDTTMDVNTVIVETLDQHVPYLLVYYWSNGKGHAVVCYRTTNHWIIFDPNCGEIRATASQLQAMWAAYWQDVQAEFGSVPVECGLASIGVVPPKKKKRCLLATAACASIGLPEDCDELERLRRFRDEIVAQRADGRAAIARYYELADEVVPLLRRDASGDVLHRIYRDTVQPAAVAIAASDTAEAVGLFHTVLRGMEAVRDLGLESLTLENMPRSG